MTCATCSPHRASPGRRERAIHDHDGFGDIGIEEYAGFERVSGLASFIAERGRIGAALLDHFSGDLDEARRAMAERYLGEHASLADYVQDMTEETTAIPESLRTYIDWRAMARDAELSADLFTLTTAWDVVHVFVGC